ncbi:uncharacterized protein LOC144799440 isoform X1 [Lissotriton helveticus]
MSLQEPYEVTFCASACFSGEEWKLLHNWQKELYRNVMKEIHQALISLGPIIASTVSTLKAKENEELYPVDDPYSGRRHVIGHYPADTAADPGVAFKMKGSNPPHLRSPLRPERRKTNDRVSTGSSYVLQHWSTNTASPSDKRNRLGTGFVNADVHLANDDEPATIFIDHMGAEMEESSAEPDMGHELVTFRIKDENETSFLDYEESMRLDSVSRTVGDKIKTRNMKAENSEKNVPRRDGTKFFLGPENAASYDLQMQPDIGPQLGGEQRLLCESGFSSAAPFNAYQESPYARSSEEGNKIRTRKIISENSGKKASRRDSMKLFPGPGNATSYDNQMQSDVGPELREQGLLYTSGFSSAAPFNVYQESQQVQSSEECKEGGSAQKQADRVSCQPEAQLNGGLYSCTECGKSFSRKGNLIKHKRIHTGVRPYQCTECDKNFNRKENLIVHLRTHSGVRPYCCSICGKSFTQMGVLIRHHTIHTHERPHQCSECDRRFSLKGNLMKHMKTHNPIR